MMGVIGSRSLSRRGEGHSEGSGARPPDSQTWAGAHCTCGPPLGLEPMPDGRRRPC